MPTNTGFNEGQVIGRQSSCFVTANGCVRVPVLSQQMVVAEPIVSQAVRWQTSALLFFSSSLQKQDPESRLMAILHELLPRQL